jgi:hypothetical protein
MLLGLTAKSVILPEVTAGPIDLNFNPLKVADLYGLLSSSLSCEKRGEAIKEMMNKMKSNFLVIFTPDYFLWKETIPL